MSLKKFGKKALAILKGVAPLAASAIGGPFAGPALAIISKAVGISENKVEDFILAASPDQLLELKKAEIELDRWREEAGIRIEELQAQDRDSARELASSRGIIVQATLSAVFILGYFGMIYLFFTNLTLENMSDFSKGQVGILIGVMTAAVPQILGFWFGSSRGSKEKTDVLATVVRERNGS